MGANTHVPMYRVQKKLCQGKLRAKLMQCRGSFFSGKISADKNKDDATMCDKCWPS